MGTLITPLQHLLRSNGRKLSEVAQATGRSRYTVRRWKNGLKLPRPDEAQRLIEFYGRELLDFNGCYEASVEVGADG